MVGNEWKAGTGEQGGKIRETDEEEGPKPRRGRNRQVCGADGKRQRRRRARRRRVAGGPHVQPLTEKGTRANDLAPVRISPINAAHSQEIIATGQEEGRDRRAWHFGAASGSPEPAGGRRA